MTSLQPSPAHADLLDPYVAMPFELILDASGDVDFTSLAGEPWGFDGLGETLSASGSATASSTASETFSTPPSSPASTTFSSPETATPTASTRPKHSKRVRVPQSQRIKAEKAYLNDQITSLQKQLADAMTRNALTNSSAPPTAWRATAKRQSARRSAAEKENQRLRTKLMHQLQIAKSLQVVMMNRSSEFFEQLEPRPCPPVWPIHDVLDGDLNKVFQQFMVDIERAYEAVDSVIPSPDGDGEIPLFERRQSTATVKAHNHNGVEQLYVELRHGYALPFTMDQVKRYFPGAARTELARQNRELEKYFLSDDVVGCKFLVRPEDSVTTFAEQETVTVLTKLFFEPSRVVMVFRAFMAARSGNFSQAMSVTTGWTMIRRLENAENHVAVHVCSRGVPLRSEIIPKTNVSLARMPSDAEEVGAFTTQMLCTSADIVSSITDSMENMILDDAVYEEAARI